MNYTIYELRLKPVSWWITDLTADTIFGHLCWQIKYEFWDEVLEDFLKSMEKEPIFTLSDVLPIEVFPRLLTNLDSYIPDEAKEDSKGLKEEKKRIKHYSKIDYINKTVLESISKSSGISKNNIKRIRDFVLWKKIKTIKKWEYSEWYRKHHYFKLGLENKNVINRLYWTTWDNWIYSQGFLESWRELSLYIKVFDEGKLKEYKIKDLLKNMFLETWYWKKKSTWKWVFEIVEDWNESDLNNFSGNNILLLSSFVPSEKDPTNGCYKLFTKFPKLGEEFSIEWHNFYKKPLLMIQAWATFKKNENYKWYVWRMIKNVDFQGRWVYHYAYWFTLEF